VPATTTLEIPADHPALPGHFPGNPIVPGVVLLDAALAQIEAALGLDLRQYQLASAKFLAIVRPGERLAIDCEALANRSVRFTIRSAEQPVASGLLAANP
jgi:3-hydroxymyristoyl/3-hydroxydecanoyl-(acyl carrier protein) dehydratase